MLLIGQTPLSTWSLRSLKVRIDWSIRHHSRVIVGSAGPGCRLRTEMISARAGRRYRRAQFNSIGLKSIKSFVGRSSPPAFGCNRRAVLGLAKSLGVPLQPRA